MTINNVVTYRNWFRADLEEVMGSEKYICRVARVQEPLPTNSTGFYDGPSYDRDTGLLEMLMRDRHGTPWESAVLRWYIETPIFLNREFFRHRIASYNETSARYRELEPVFYLPPPERPLVQTGKPGAYAFSEGGPEMHDLVMDTQRQAYQVAWAAYQRQLKAGVAKEVARNVLPVSVYSPFYVTMNLRAFFNFLSLRRKTDDTTVPTFPQWEINRLAGLMEDQAIGHFPRAMRLFNKYGRIAP